MKFLSRILGFGVKPHKSTESRTTAVTQVAGAALKRYEKTFADLARYDRGEKPLISLPR